MVLVLFKWKKINKFFENQGIFDKKSAIKIIKKIIFVY